MKVTSITQQAKSPDRVSVFVDGKYSFSLSLDQLLEHKLKKDQELDEAQLKQLKQASQDGKLLARTLEWLLMRPHSEKELRDYLYKKKVDKTQIQGIVDHMRSRRYVDDHAFATWFADNRRRKNKSTKAITAELRSKGISPLTIQSIVTDAMSSTSEDQALKEMINKLSKRPRYASDQQKFMRYLISKGFSYEQVKQALAAHTDSNV